MRVRSALPDHSETVIIGGGVIGASCAWWLERAGHSVTLLERRNGLGTYSTPNALGTIRTQYGTPALVAMAQESLEFYRSISTHLGVDTDVLGWANQGYLYLITNPEHVPRLFDSLAEYEALGVTSSSVIEQPNLSERFPFVGDAVAAIFHGDGSWIDPAQITSAWADAATKTDVVFDTEVTSLERVGDSWIVETSRGSLSAERVIVCSGAKAPAFLAPFGVSAPVKITPRYRVFIPDDDPAHRAAPLVINIANGAYWRPVPGGVWLSTADVDEGSVEAGEGVTAPPGFLDRCLSQIEPISPALVAHARSLPPDAFEYAGGYQSYPADDVPIIGAVPGHEGLFVNYGHWAGVMLSPASGRLLAEVVAGSTDESDNPCAITRFDRPVDRSSTNKFGGWG
jgi:sarcosine oxidase subunit beta